MTDGTLPGRARKAAEAAYRNWRIGDDGEGRLHAALVAYERERTPLSAVCTGPDCGERFTDSETDEYLFASRERMERLLRADGWRVDPVLCPACQPDGT